MTDIKEQALLTDEEIQVANQITPEEYGAPPFWWLKVNRRVANAQLNKAYPIFFEAGYQAGLSQQETPRIDLECELADEEFRKEFHIARKKANLEMYKAGIKKGIKKGKRQVIEWVKEQQYECKNPEDMAYHWLLIPPDDWQSYLKEVEE